MLGFLAVREHRVLSTKPKILFVSDGEPTAAALVSQLREHYDVVESQSSLRALSRLARENFVGVYVASQHLSDAVQVGKLLQNERILQGMPDGIVLLDSDNMIIWGNGRLREWTGSEKVVGANFYAILGSPEILGPDFCPFHTALATGRASSSTLRSPLSLDRRPKARFWSIRQTDLRAGRSTCPLSTMRHRDAHLGLGPRSPLYLIT